MDKGRKAKLFYKLADLVRTEDVIFFDEGDTTILSFRLCPTTEVINDAMASYQINNLLERYKEALLKTSEWTMQEKKMSEL